jgi:hypothetical protein
MYIVPSAQILIFALGTKNLVLSGVALFEAVVAECRKNKGSTDAERNAWSSVTRAPMESPTKPLKSK